ncbi:MAG: Uma2 family endonuclease [Candidatus Methylomirabilia bacterium]
MVARSGETQRPLPPGKMTFEEFLAWCDEDTWAEWVDGEVMMLSPASRRHQDLRDFLVVLLRAFAESRERGTVWSAPFLMRLPNVPSGREPDLLFVVAAQQDHLRETYLDGAADLVVEIVSPESRLRDRGEKFAEYELGGVGEYWLIDPDQRGADFYRLDVGGRYQRVPVGAEGVYRSEVVPGFWLKVEWLWQEPLRPVLSVLGELGLLS